VIDNISKVFIGKTEVAEMLLTGLLAGGHILLDDVPGVGKTLLARSLAKSVGGIFKRVQFTPDLLPTDITGFNVYDRQSGQFKFQSGPIMSNILLADEINRAIPRSQSSLLESMEEGQVTVDGVTLDLPRPFMVIATQNPVEMEGTFPLPEAQLDRFLLRLKVGYPRPEEECSILERFQKDDPLSALQAVITPAQVIDLQTARQNIIVSAPVKEYIVNLVRATRTVPALLIGASPRASLHLMRAAQALAVLRGRHYLLPDDVKRLVEPVLAHRLGMEVKETVRGITAESILLDIINNLPVPLVKEQE
jgi:MoxR-like ATPase